MGILSAHAQQVSNRTQAAHLLSVGPKECQKHNFSLKNIMVKSIYCMALMAETLAYQNKILQR